MSLGPSSRRRGTPFISYSANFQPADWSEASILARMPAAFRRFMTASLASRTPSLCWATGMMITWVGAMRGGSTRPLLSPWVMITPPMRRVDTPQEVWKGLWGWLSLPAKVMPKARAKPSPK